MPNTTQPITFSRFALSAHRIKYHLAVVLLCVASFTNAASDEIHFAQSGPVPQLLELFTSQGCSSCPPADAFVNKLLTDQGLWNKIVPVVFHVDYWDYLGWEDLYSDASYSSRQRRYRALGRIDSVYTPGFVVDAREWRGYFSNAVLPKRRNRRGGALNIDSIDGAKSRLRIRYQSDSESPAHHYVHLALLGFGIKTKIRSGENRGEYLPYEFTVLNFQTEPLRSADAVIWEGEMGLAKAKRKATSYGLAAWVTTANEPTPAQVLGGWLNAGQMP